MSDIRLGRGRKRAISLGDVKSDPIENGTDCLTVDWVGIVKQLRFSRFDRAVFFKSYRDAVPHHRLPAAMGATPREIAMACSRIAAALASGDADSFVILGGSSLKLAYQERVAGGAYSYELARVGPEFAEIMRREKLFLFSDEQFTKTFAKRNVFCPLSSGAHDVTIEKLEKALSSERAELMRIADQQDKVRSTLRVCQNDLETFSASIEVGRVEAVLGNKTFPAAGDQKKLAALELAIGDAEKQLQATGRAIQIKQEKIQDFEGQLKARELEIMRTKFEPAAVALDEAFRVLAAAAGKVRVVLEEVGQADLTAILFPLAPKGGEGRDWPEVLACQARVKAYNAGISLLSNPVYDRKKEAAAA